MSQSEIELTDDDDSFNPEIQEVSMKEGNNKKVVEISSDEDINEKDGKKTKMPRQTIIKNLFPKSKPKTFSKITSTAKVRAEPNKPCLMKEKMIGGVKVELPVDPYPCQTILMAKVIEAIKKSQNCLLESPTGSGKTLALLCAALAWQKKMQCEVAEAKVEQYFSDHPKLKQIDGAEKYITTPTKKNIGSPEKFFSRPVHGHKSIYDPVCEEAGGSADTRKKTYEDCCAEDQNDNFLVKIHKKQKLECTPSDQPDDVSPTWTCATPEKDPKTRDQQTPERIHVPKIYYGARTHKQLQQVIKEFSNTGYCGDMTMTILSSRDNSCIREYDRHQWSSKNDMCRGCIKKLVNDDNENRMKNNTSTNCKYYDNRKVLNHDSLPPAFDLENLVMAGEANNACPYYAAREMAVNANIVFCPYNYLIDPAIRNSLQIKLENDIVIVDEAHNIEDICRDAATFTITRDQIAACIKELQAVSEKRYSSHGVGKAVDNLLRTLNNWDQWFVNQTPLINKQAVNDSEAAYVWDVTHFVQSLHNHTIGREQYAQFERDAEQFTRQLREDPRTLQGVTQPTGTLIESIQTVLGYLFRAEGKYMDDFRPVLLRNVSTANGDGGPSWRRSQFEKSIEKEQLSLRLICLNPAVVFEQLQAARSIILASGTLTPLISLHSELGTNFPLKISTKHVISKERVWIGTLKTGSTGSELRCVSEGLSKSGVQDGLGEALLQVARVTPHGVLCFLPSYSAMNQLIKRWQETGVWAKLEDLKHVFKEQRNARDHNETMEDYYKYVSDEKGAILFAVYRGKVSEGMDFKDQQARAVVAVGIPYPSTYDLAVRQKMLYNDKYSAQRSLLRGGEWLRVQAYRALNQAVGRCVRHRGDWGAVLLVDSRFSGGYYTEHLSGWVRDMLQTNHHTYQSLVEGPNSLEEFMQYMTIRETEDV